MGRETRFRPGGVALYVEEGIAEKVLCHLVLLANHCDDDFSECLVKSRAACSSVLLSRM